MFEIIYMKADYEPWWMFEGWEEDVVTREQFTKEDEAYVYLHTLMDKLKQRYEHSKVKKNCFFAFWTSDEIFFCEGCDDDAQVYHGVILLKDGKPYEGQ